MLTNKIVPKMELNGKFGHETSFFSCFIFIFSKSVQQLNNKFIN